MSPNIRGVGLSKVEVLLAWGPAGARGVSIPDGIPDESRLKSFASLLCLGELETLKL